MARKPEPCRTSAPPKATAAKASDATGYRPADARLTCRSMRTATQPTAMPTAPPMTSSSTIANSMSSAL